MISARGLTKRFAGKGSTVDAVRALDLDVDEGELVAFLGPNGAGKSTSLRMLTTLLPPSSGSAIVAGHDIARDPAAVRRRIGYVGQGQSGGNNQRVIDELHAQGSFYGLGRRDTARRATELLASLDLEPLARRTVSALSGGQKRRLDIALGLIHAPALLFLDEPSTGLDPQSRANLWQHILELRRRHGTTVFVTTHYLDEADQFAERVLVMDHGQVIADAPAPTLKSRLAGDVLTVTVTSAHPGDGAADARLGVRALEVASRTLAAFARPDAARQPSLALVDPVPSVAAAHPGRMVAGLELVVDAGDRVLPVLLGDLAAADLPAASATLRQPTLDDVFLALTGRSLRDSAATAPAPVA